MPTRTFNTTTYRYAALDAKERFPGDIANHQMRVMLDVKIHDLLGDRQILASGMSLVAELTPKVNSEDPDQHTVHYYRHLAFRQPSTANLWFDLITWPEYLTIAGDMGTWTFARIPDMFEFFRQVYKGGPDTADLKINADYWSEKLMNGQSSGIDAAKVWSDDLFKLRLVDRLTNYYSLEGSDLVEVTQALQDEVLIYDNKHELLNAAANFTHSPNGEKSKIFCFDNCDLPDGKEYSYHFIWCLYAIVWGIKQYDLAKAGQHLTQDVAEI